MLRVSRDSAAQRGNKQYHARSMPAPQWWLECSVYCSHQISRNAHGLQKVECNLPCLLRMGSCSTSVSWLLSRFRSGQLLGISEVSAAPPCRVTLGWSKQWLLSFMVTLNCRSPSNLRLATVRRHGGMVNSPRYLSRLGMSTFRDTSEVGNVPEIGGSASDEACLQKAAPAQE